MWSNHVPQTNALSFFKKSTVIAFDHQGVKKKKQVLQLLNIQKLFFCTLKFATC